MATPTTLPASFTTGQVLTAAQMNNLRGAFRVLQVASTTKTDAFSMTSLTYANVTGLSVTITPRESTSRILLIASVASGAENGMALKITGGNTANYVGDAAGSRVRAAVAMWTTAINSGIGQALVYLDNPATTSAITYQVQAVSTYSTTVAYVNRGHTNTDTTDIFRTASTITALEISA